jgi:hypothetical protein
VRIVASGDAQAKGVSGASSGDRSKVEGVFKYVSPGVVPSGVSMYLYKGGAIEANSSFDLTEADGAGLMIRNGDLNCDKNNTVINGSVLISGNLTFTGNCSINKNAWVGGAATLGSGSVSGDLVAASVSPNPPGTHVGGTYTQGGTMPVASPWTDIAYAPADWVDSSGAAFETRAVSGTSCMLDAGNLGGTVAGKPVVLNALGCVGGMTGANNVTVNLTSDVVIFAQQFTFDYKVTFASATTAAHRLWFVTPDYIANGTPDCQRALSPQPQGDFWVKNNLVIQDPEISAMLYTPCAFVAKNGFEWHGQIYSGQYSYVQNNPQFTYVPVGIAGADLLTGGPTTVILKSQPGAVVTMRDLAGG